MALCREPTEPAGETRGWAEQCREEGRVKREEVKIGRHFAVSADFWVGVTK